MQNAVRLRFLLLFVLFAGLGWFMFGCSGNKEKNPENVVARVYDEYLLLEDIGQIVPPRTLPEDSIQIINDFIDQWIRKKLMLKLAEKNLSKEQKDVSRQIEDYRSSLLIFTYQQELIRQSIDTVVTENEIVDYYNTHKLDFELKDNIVKVRYVKLSKGQKVPAFKRLIQSDKDQDLQKLMELSAKYAVNSYLDDQNWLVFNDILKEIPIKTYNQEEYLKNNDLIEIEDSLYTYLLNIKGFMIKESISPLSFETGNIRSIIINKRKLKMISELEKNVYEDALKSGDFEIKKITR